MESLMKNVTKVFLVLALVTACVALPACNTTKGLGEDIEKAGDGLKDSADKHGAD